MSGSGKFLVRRIAGALVTLLAVSMATFGLFFAVPGDPAALQCGRTCTNEQIVQIRRSLGLDRPVIEQYAEFMIGVFAGRTLDVGTEPLRCPAPCLGYSFSTFEPVTAVIGRALPVTLSVVVGGATAWLVTGGSIGVLAARRRGTWVDRLVVGAALVGGSTQTFFVGLMLEIVLVFGLGWLPLPSYVSPLEDPAGWVGGMLLPWATLGTVFAAAYARLTRSQMIEVLAEDYIRTGRGKGLRERTLLRQALRAAMTPLVTIAGLDIGVLMGGAVITETVFGLPGIGMVSVQAAQSLNLPVVMAVVLIGAFFVVSMNLVVDVLYLVIDPRIRLR